MCMCMCILIVDNFYFSVGMWITFTISKLDLYNNILQNADFQAFFMGYIVKNVKIIIVDNLRIKMYFGIHFLYIDMIQVFYSLYCLLYTDILVFLYFSHGQLYKCLGSFRLFCTYMADNCFLYNGHLLFFLFVVCVLLWLIVCWFSAICVVIL